MVDLDDIVDIKIAAHSNLRKYETKIRDKLDKANPWELILEENPQFIYRGKVTFMFKNKYLKGLLKRFGNPDGEIKQDTQYLTEYTVTDTTITTKDLFWLASLPDNGVRLKSSQELIQSVKRYYSHIANVLTDARKRYLLWNKQ